MNNVTLPGGFGINLSHDLQRKHRDSQSADKSKRNFTTNVLLGFMGNNNPTVLTVICGFAIKGDEFIIVGFFFEKTKHDIYSKIDVMS